MFTRTKIALAAILIAGASSAAMAQTLDTAGPSGTGVAAGSPFTLAAYRASSQHGRVRQSRNARLNTYAPAQDTPPVSVVQPDNYKWGYESCCF